MKANLVLINVRGDWGVGVTKLLLENCIFLGRGGDGSQLIFCNIFDKDLHIIFYQNMLFSV